MATGRTVREKDAGVDLLRHPDVLVKEFKFTEAFNLNDDVPNIQHSAAALHVESVSAHRPTQHQGYFTTFAQEIDFIGKIEAMVDKGQVLVHVLYTYRSVSQAIPETSMNLSNPSKEQEAEAAAKRAEINRKILDVLRPEIVKLKELVSYTLSAVTLFHGCVAHFANKEARKEIVPESMHLALLQLMDTLLILDNLKDIKTCLQADFARYKRVVGAHPSIEILEEITQLQAFLSNPDPRKARNYVFLCLRDEVKRITGHENVFLDALELAQDTLQRGAFVTPEEQFRLLRVLPYLLLVADGEADDVKSFNVFKTGKIKLSNLQKIFKRFPVVPLYGDMTIVMEYVLRRSGHYETKMGTSWGRGPIDGEPEASKPLAPYDLVAQWAAQYAPRLAASLHRLQRYPFQKVQDDVSENVSAAVFALGKDPSISLYYKSI
ncbi:hypothetical protein B484DRAFT_404062 [Ochromonadaceae sp. CCMP2298]|nr:hypothetical protein B484DRAFT_404062 [Ochromonadaceae sp. CCMP2298]